MAPSSPDKQLQAALERIKELEKKVSELESKVKSLESQHMQYKTYYR